MLLTYEEFKREFTSHIKEYLPLHYQDWDCKINTVLKVNGCKEAFNLLSKDTAGASPNLYLDELYAFYKECNSMEEVCKTAAGNFCMAMVTISDIKLEMSAKEWPKDRIIYTLISQEKNEKLLSKVPHRLTMNLAVIYRFIEHAEEGFNSCLITNEIAAEMGITEESLYELAAENTHKLLPPEIHLCEDGIALITNKGKIFGATSMLAPNLLNQLANEISSDLIILPSSLHEVFVIPDVGKDISGLNEIVRSANESVVSPEDFLSNTAYRYILSENKINIVV